MIEAWYFEHFEKQKSVDDWLRMLNEPPTPLPDDVWAVCGRAAVRTAERILQQVVGAPLELAAPPGWDAETLLAESLAVAQGSL